jgi:lipoic acid synthetase
VSAERARREPKPPWLKVRAPGGENYTRIKQTLRQLDLYTVCEEARCPNVGECWASGTATVMLLGHTCTRGCRFCAVTTGNPRGAVDPREPEHVARAIASMELRYVVLTMVDRDDLLDGGAEHVATTVRALKRRRPDLLVETLVGDFRGRLQDVEVVQEGGPDVFAHNIEVTRGLTKKIRDARCDYDTSLEVLRHAKRLAPQRLTKSSIMVGFGETYEEVLQTMRDLRAADVDVVTIGQYLQPTPRHAPLERYVTPEEFTAFEQRGLEMGFSFVASGALVRSSYHAAEAFMAARLAGPAEQAQVAATSREPRAAGAVGAGQVGEPSWPTPADSSSGLVPASRLLRRRASSAAEDSAD